MRKWIENHLGLVMLIACGVGFIVPGIARLPDESAIVALAVLMFISCYKLRDGGFASVRRYEVARFYILRYAILPLGMYWLAFAFVPTYAMGVFLLSAVPTGASSPAFVNVYGGSVATAFVLVLASQILTPLLIPAQFALISGDSLSVAPEVLFRTLVLTILLPMGLYYLVRGHAPSATYFYDRNRLFSILIIFFVIMLVIAKQREVILADPIGLLPVLGLVLLCYFIYLVFGWWAGRREPEARMAYTVCSGFNNAALGVSLALLYFPPPIVLFFAAAEIGWALLPALMKLWFRPAN